MRLSGWLTATVAALSFGVTGLSTAYGATGDAKDTKTTPAAPPKKQVDSAFNRLPRGQLLDALTMMNMTELVKGLQGELGTGTLADMDLAVKTLLIEAQKEPVLERRNELLDGVIETRKRMVEQAAGATEANAQLCYMDYKFKLADLMGRTRVEPYVLRLLYLRGSQKDRQEIIDLTGQAIAIIDEVTGRRGEMESVIAKIGRNRPVLVLLLPQIDDLKARVNYYSGWIYLYRGMALPDTGPQAGERYRLLMRALESVTPFAAGADDSGVKYWAMLLCGRANRELHNHKEAEKWLTQLLKAEGAEKEAQVEAMFELARNKIEKGRTDASKKDAKAPAIEAAFKDAESAVNDYQKNALAAIGPAGKIQVDLKYALLSNYLYETWSAAMKSDAKKSAEMATKAQQALLGFIAVHKEPKTQLAYFEIVGPKYRDRADYASLDPAVLISVAFYEWAQRTPDSKKKAGKIADEILSRKAADGPDAETLKTVQPLARVIKSWQSLEEGDMAKAADDMLTSAMELVKTNHPNAYNTTLNACKAYYQAIRNLEKAQTPVSQSLRERFVRALELLLSKEEWRKGNTKDNLPFWMLQLAVQCEELAKLNPTAGWLAKASTYYGMVPADQPEYMQAQHLRLDLAVSDLGNADPNIRAAKAPAMVQDLRKYAAMAKAEADKAKAGNPEKFKDLMNWGGRAAFQAVAIEYDELGKTKEASAVLDKLPSEWPDTLVLSEVSGFQINVLIREKKTKEAIARLQEFMNKYPQEAASLLRLVLDQIQERIKDTREVVRTNPTNNAAKADLDNYRSVFLDFAQDLYNQGTDPNAKPSEQRISSLKRTLGDAYVENGKAQEALKLFEEVLVFENRMIEEYRKTLDAEYAKKTAAVEKYTVNEDANSLRGLAADLLKVKAECRQADSTATDNVQRALAMLNDSNSKHKIEARIQELGTQLQKALVEQGERRKASVQPETRTLLGLARSYRGLGQYEKSIENYRKVLRSLDRNSMDYWQRQLEHCDVLLEGYKKDPAAMKNLADYIASLRADDETYHGLKTRFIQLEAEAKSLSGAK